MTRRAILRAADRCLALWAAEFAYRGQSDPYAYLHVSAYGAVPDRAPSGVLQRYCYTLVQQTPGYTALEPVLVDAWIYGNDPVPRWCASYRARVEEIEDAALSASHADFTGRLYDDLRTFAINLGMAYIEGKGFEPALQVGARRRGRPASKLPSGR